MRSGSRYRCPSQSRSEPSNGSVPLVLIGVGRPARARAPRYPDARVAAAVIRSRFPGSKPPSTAAPQPLPPGGGDRRRATWRMVDLTFVDGPGATHRRMLRARDAMDRDFALPLRVPSLAAIACVSEANFIRTFKATFGETPHRYLQRRRIERAMFLLRETDRSVTEISLDVGFNSLGTFSRPFREIVGETPTAYRLREDVGAVPTCFAMAWTRPSSFGEAGTPDR